jgi:pilus assembly protein CpaC
MNKSIFIITFGLFTLINIFRSLPQARAETADSIVLGIGLSEEWKTPRGGSVSVSNGSVIRLKDLGDRVKITAKKIGDSVVHAGTHTAEVHVIAAPLFRLYERLHEALIDRRGLELVVSGTSLSVRGRLLRWEDWQALADAAKNSTASYSFEAEVSLELSGSCLQRLHTILRKANLPDQGIDLHPVASVSVPADPKDLKARVSEVLKPYGFRVDVSSTALSLEPLVRVRIIVAEFKRSMARTIGIEWPKSAQIQLLPTPIQSSDSALLATIHAMEINGMGTILASPTLLCRSGKEAQFLAGGEFPIKIHSFRNDDVVWKQYGVRLKIRPLADYSGRMSIALETEVSEIDDANKVDGIPGLSTNRIESHFDLASSRTIALSGLIKKKSGESLQGLPWLLKIPILGQLFSSKDFRDEKTELVVFVTPDIAKFDEGGL